MISATTLFLVFLTACASAQVSPLSLPKIPDFTISVGYDPSSNIVIPSPADDAKPYIQQALANVSAAGGGVVFVGQGNYTLSGQLFLGAATHLKGAGMDATFLRLVDNAAPWKVGTSSRSGFVRSHMMDDQQVSEITLDGNKQNQRKDGDYGYGRYGLFTEGSQRVFFDRVRIQNFQGYGFDPHGWKSGFNGPVYGVNLTITNCISVNNEWDGFTLDQTYGIYLFNNTALTNGRHGFNLVTGSQGTIME